MSDGLDQIWKALSDETRRGILDMLRTGPAHDDGNRRAFSRPDALRRDETFGRAASGGTRCHSRRGPSAYHSINAVPIRMIYERWVSHFENLWANTLLRIKESAERAAKPARPAADRNKSSSRSPEAGRRRPAINLTTSPPNKEPSHDQSQNCLAGRMTAARQQLLQEEKEFTHRRDELSCRRRELPWERVEKQYVFDTPVGKKSLAELFDGRSQLIVYHFMLGPDWEEGCHGCSYVSDHFDGSLPHIAARDVSFVAGLARSLAKIEGFKKRMSLAIFAGSRRTAATSTTTTRCRSQRRADRRKGLLQLRAAGVPQ